MTLNRMSLLEMTTEWHSANWYSTWRHSQELNEKNNT